jgi:DUF4097 and DUF4098 domain-containing protein YvlB
MILIALLCATIAGPARAAQKDLTKTESFPSIDSKELVVDVTDIDVRLRTADVETIDADVLLRISATGEEKALRWIEVHTPSFYDAEKRLQIIVEPAKTGFLWFGSLTAKARLSLKAPDEVIPDITTTSGAIQIRGDFPNARPLHLRTSTGNAEMEGATASIDFHSAAGDLQVRVVRPLESLAARTSSGDIHLSGGARQVTVDTASGHIALHNLSGSAEVSTSTGKITLRWDRLESDTAVRVRSSSGRVQLIVPAGVRPQGTITTTTGSVRSEFPGEVVEGGMTLRLSGDGPTFDVETASAEVQLSISEVWQ